MKHSFRIFLWPLLALGIYLLVQGLSAIPLGLINYFDPDADTALWIGVTLLVSSVVSSIILLCIPQFGLRTAFRGTGCNSTTTLIAIAGTLFTVLASDIVNEWLDLPNEFEDMFVGMSENLWGMLAISLFGPICEEIVFRGGLMKPLLDRGANPWVAIGFSALIFGLVHGNPAQIPFAAMVGIVFGIIYYRTGSLVITTLCHILNNSFSVILMNIYGSEADDLTFEHMLGRTETGVTFILAVVAAVVLLRLFWKRTE